MHPFFTPNATVPEHLALLQPWQDELASMNATLGFGAEPTYFDKFYDAWTFGFPLEQIGYDAGLSASRLFPRANFANETLLGETFAAIRNTTAAGFAVTGFNFKNVLHLGNTAGSANPALRDALMHGITGAFWEDGASVETIVEVSNSLTYECMDQWRAVTVGSGAYINEVR